MLPKVLPPGRCCRCRRRGGRTVGRGNSGCCGIRGSVNVVFNDRMGAGCNRNPGLGPGAHAARPRHQARPPRLGADIISPGPGSDSVSAVSVFQAERAAGTRHLSHPLRAWHRGVEGGGAGPAARSGSAGVGVRGAVLRNMFRSVNTEGSVPVGVLRGAGLMHQRCRRDPRRP